ncbi:MAG: hypothetical protein CBC29_07155 [Methylococcaceae bacterium TMED69]|nr:MAG: hypothetical protein CBC29_07155 [Methylococcaceae bacterium TMED69]|tara:strand:+ start:2155 stop:3144 length:990 start_codon:yes stop_codon:yes gene_type:complete
MKNNVLVTGGLGFIGSNLSRELMNKGYRVWVVDDYSNSKLDPEDFFKTPVRNLVSALSRYYDVQTDPKSPKIVFIEADFNHDAILERISSGFFRKVFHLAAKPRVEWSVQNPMEATDENFNKSLKLAIACATGNCRLIFSSTSAVYGNTGELPSTENSKTAPTSPYGLSKLCCEQYFELFENLYGLDWVALRYFNAYGPGQDGSSPYSTAVSSWCSKAIKGESLRKDGDGSQSRDLVHVSDIVSANICVSEAELNEEKVFNVGLGKSYTNNYILEKFSSRGYTQITEASEREGDVKHTLANIDKLRALGWEPNVGFEEGLESVFDYWGL